MRVTAILAAYNEERFIGACLEHLGRQGVQAYLIDNDSTDQTREIASRYLGRGLVGIERLPRDGIYRWGEILQTKERVVRELDSDWFMHVDPDEFHLPPTGYMTLAQAFEAIDREGYTAANFDEYTFIPVREAPDHDHAYFLETMRWYYPFAPRPLFRMNAWKNTGERVDIASTGGHQIWFDSLNVAPNAFMMRHYLFLSVPHAVRKFVRRVYDPNAIEGRDWRARLTPELVVLPPARELRYYRSDAELDSSNPKRLHYLQEVVNEHDRANPELSPIARADEPD